MKSRFSRATVLRKFGIKNSLVVFNILTCIDIRDNTEKEHDHPKQHEKLAALNVSAFKSMASKDTPKQPTLEQAIAGAVGHTVDRRYAFRGFVVDGLIAHFCGGYITTFTATKTNAWTKQKTKWATWAWRDINFS